MEVGRFHKTGWVGEEREEAEMFGQSLWPPWTFIWLLLQSSEVSSLLNLWLFWVVKFVMPAFIKTEGRFTFQAALLHNCQHWEKKQKSFIHHFFYLAQYTTLQKLCVWLESAKWKLLSVQLLFFVHHQDHELYLPFWGGMFINSIQHLNS